MKAQTVKRSAEAGHAATEGSTENNRPLKTIVIDDVSASIFARKHQGKDEIRTFYSVSFSRSYRDKEDRRHYVKTFNLEDLGKVVTVAQRADEYIRGQVSSESEK